MGSTEESKRQAISRLRGLIERSQQSLKPTGCTGPGLALRPGVVHEWICGGLECSQHRKRWWAPPLAVLASCAKQRATHADAASGQVIWVGNKCWPYGQSLIERGPSASAEVLGGIHSGLSLLSRSIFVDPADRVERVWAIEQAVRCSGVAAVIADGSGLKMPETRRLQLAAEASQALVFLARPPWEAKASSAAHTRWRVTPVPAIRHEQAWRVELLRCKGVQPFGDARRWVVRREYATGRMGEWQACDVDLAPDVVDRPLQAAFPRLA